LIYPEESTIIAGTTDIQKGRPTCIGELWVWQPNYIISPKVPPVCDGWHLPWAHAFMDTYMDKKVNSVS